MQRFRNGAPDTAHPVQPGKRIQWEVWVREGDEWTFVRHFPMWDGAKARKLADYYIREGRVAKVVKSSPTERAGAMAHG